MLTYVQSGIFSATLNTACRWSKLSAKKNILSVDKVVTFEATPKFWGMEEWRKCCKEMTQWMRSKAFPVGVDFMARCSLSIYLCALSSSFYCIIVVKSPSLMIICSLFSRLLTSSSSSHCSNKASWASLEIAVLSSGWIYMAITAYHSWGDLIYHLLGTDLLRSIFGLFLAVSFETLSSLCYNNLLRIPLLSVAGQRLSRYQAVILIFYMMRNVNVNINIDLCFTLSCKLVRRLPNFKRWKLSTAHMPECLRGVRWSEECQLERCTNQKVRCTSANLPKRCSCTVICWNHWLLTWHSCFLQLENSCCKVIR